MSPTFCCHICGGEHSSSIHTVKTVTDHKYIAPACHEHGCQLLVLTDAIQRLLTLDSISNREFARAAISQTLCKGCGKPLGGNNMKYFTIGIVIGFLLATWVYWPAIMRCI